jgi:hypothetical protein
MGNKRYDKDYYKEYNKKNLTRVSLNLSNTKDQDIIKAIERESPDNIQAGVKSLIRRAINNNEG